MAAEGKQKTFSLDELLPRLGHPGKFQACVFLLLALNYFPVCFNHVIMAFYGSTPPHQCIAKDLEKWKDNLTTGDSVISYGKCTSVYTIENLENRTINCQDDDAHGSWSYTTTSDRESTIITEVRVL